MNSGVTGFIRAIGGGLYTLFHSGVKGKHAKAAVAISLTLAVGGAAAAPQDFWKQEEYFAGKWWHDPAKVDQAILALQTEINEKGRIKLPDDAFDPNKMAAIQRVIGALTTKEYNPQVPDVIQTIMSKN